MREATHALHLRVERAALPARILSAQVTIDDYRAFLAVHQVVIAPWAIHCPRQISIATQSDPSGRARALASDIAALGRGDFPGDPLSLAPVFPWPGDSPQWWGSCYVIEGSRLGGRVIARHLRESLGDEIAVALSYLDHDPSMVWPTTLGVIDSALSHGAIDDACEGARRTFELFDLAFARQESAILA